MLIPYEQESSDAAKCYAAATSGNSPELNPIENLWHYLKSHFWSNRAYAGYDELETAAIDAWRRAVLNPDLMKTVCAAKYLKRADLN